MADGRVNLGIHDTEMAISRRAAIGRTAALSAMGMVAGSVAMPAWATSPTDARLGIYEGRYAIDSHKIVDGYFAAPRGRTGMDVLVVIPGEGGLDDTVRDIVRRHALGGTIAFAPDLAKTSGMPLASREAMIADFVAHTPRLKRHRRGNGTVRIVAA